MTRRTKTIVGELIAILAFAGWIEAVKAQGALQPVNLRCEARVNPLGIGNGTPELSWQLQYTGSGAAYRGLSQSAYEIQVGSAPGAADLWDSGKVVGSQSINIVYAGKAVTSGESCFWQVRVYDNSNNVSAWSASAQWSMGLLSPSDWTAQWIGYDAAYNLTPQQATNKALFNTSNLDWIVFPVHPRSLYLEWWSDSSLRMKKFSS